MRRKRFFFVNFRYYVVQMILSPAQRLDLRFERLISLPNKEVCFVYSHECGRFDQFVFEAECTYAKSWTTVYVIYHNYYSRYRYTSIGTQINAPQTCTRKSWKFRWKRNNIGVVRFERRIRSNLTGENYRKGFGG